MRRRWNFFMKELVKLLEGQLAMENKWVYEKRKGTSGAGKVEFQVPR